VNGFNRLPWKRVSKLCTIPITGYLLTWRMERDSLEAARDLDGSDIRAMIVRRPEFICRRGYDRFVTADVEIMWGGNRGARGSSG